MARANDNETAPLSQGAGFTTTHWSVVLSARAGETPAAREAIETLCRSYWYPLYVYARRQEYGVEEARDLIQEFFASFLTRESFKLADPAKGRFRTFLLASIQHFLISNWRKTTAHKRGGGVKELSWDAQVAEQSYAAEPVNEWSPDRLYDRTWATAIMERVTAQLRDEYRDSGRASLFDRVKDCAWGKQGSDIYADLADQLGLTENALKVSVHRLRRRCRELLRAEVAQTVARFEDVEEELRYLISVLGP